jgi:hypothetical protein
MKDKHIAFDSPDNKFKVAEKGGEEAETLDRRCGFGVDLKTIN